jgi:hypothetical protein
MISVQQLLVPVTATQARSNAVTALVAMGIRADLWRVGGSMSTMLTVITAAYANFTVLFAQAIASGFLTTASGGWLSLLAFYVYGVTRPVATFATGALTLTNTGGGVFNYPVGAATFLDSTSGQTYTNQSVIALGALSAQTINIQCTVSGSIGNAPPGEIDTLQTAMQNVTCGNAAAIAGSDALSDPGLVALCLAKLGALSVRGPRNAYAFAITVALNAVTGAPVNINRQSISRSSHTGTVTIVVASPSGSPDPNDVAGVVTSIESGVPGLSPPFSGVRPDCVTVNVSGATEVPYAQTLTVWAEAEPGLTAAALATQVGTALTAWLSNYPVGGVTTDQGTGLWATGINSAVGEVSQTIFSVEGAEDLALVAGEVATDEITINVRLVTLA